MEYILENSRKLPVAVETDVVVIGGGPAGVGAAIRAARGGAKTYLVEKFGSLGGIMTNGFVSTVAKFGPLAMEIMDRLEEDGYVSGQTFDWPDLRLSRITHNGRHFMNQPVPEGVFPFFGFDPDMMAYVMMELCMEAGVQLSFRNQFVDCIVEDGSIKAVVVENPSGRQAIVGKVFIDCTGRGDVVARAGSPCRSQGNDDGWGHMAAGLMYKLSNVDIAKVFEYERRDPGLQVAMEKARTRGECPPYHPKSRPNG